MRTFLLLSTLLVLLSSCAVKPTQVNLVPTGTIRASVPFDMELKTVAVVIAEQSAQTGKVMVDATFPPLWKDAIQTAVDEAGLFKDDSSKKVTISALIKKFEFNPTGFSNTCDTEVSYKVIDRSNGKEIFLKNIVTTSSNSAKNTWNANERLINLWNTTTQESIRKFVESLKLSDLKK